jgi:hypothetical protein
MGECRSMRCGHTSAVRRPLKPGAGRELRHACFETWSTRVVTPRAKAPLGVSRAAASCLSSCCSLHIWRHLSSSTTHIHLSQAWVPSRSPSARSIRFRSSLGWFHLLERTSSRRRSWRLVYASMSRCAGAVSRCRATISDYANDHRRRRSRKITKVMSSSAFKSRVFSQLPRVSSRKQSEMLRLNLYCNPT